MWVYYTTAQGLSTWKCKNPADACKYKNPADYLCREYLFVLYEAAK
jgi:hypothetical protein